MVGSQCHVCQKAISRSNLARHLRQAHKISRCGGFHCALCEKSYRMKHNLKRHIFRVHFAGSVVESSKAKRRKCNSCGIKVYGVKNLRTHVQCSHESKSHTKCPLCSEMITDVKKLEIHLTECHEYLSDSATLQFDSYEDFKTHKDEIEKEQQSFFAKIRTKKNKSYYECHRSGNPQNRNPPSTSKLVKNMTTKLRCRKSVKIGATCPARIVTTSSENGIKAFFQLQHAGHDCSALFLRLTKKEKTIIASKIDLGDSLDRISDDGRDSVSHDIERIHLIEKKDSRNIKFDMTSDALLAAKTVIPSARKSTDKIDTSDRNKLKENLLACLALTESMSDAHATELLALTNEIMAAR